MSIQIKVSFGKDSFDVSISGEETVEKIMVKLEAQTGVFVRKQKLIFKGKVLSFATKIADTNLKSGSKLMLMATSGDVQTQASS